MSRLTFGCIAATTFTNTGEIDEEGFRRFMNRFVDAKVAVYLGSGANGEGHSLTLDELRRIYTIGVEECKGKVSIEAHIPEEFTAKAIIEHAQMAIKTGIEVLHIYAPEGRHYMRPTNPELVAYYDDIFSVIRHRAALVVNPAVGYAPEPRVVADICRKHTQIETVILIGVPETYLFDLKSMITREITYNFRFSPTVLNALMMGATATCGGEGSIIPKTYQRYVDCYEKKDFEGLALVYADLRNFDSYVRKWGPAGPRWIKMCMKVLKLPGEGGPRRPYLLPPEQELQKFADGLLRLGVPEIEELARAAGLSLPGK